MDLKRSLLLFLAIFCACGAAAHGGPRGTAETTINSKKISIDYGRPSLKGRDLLSQAKVGMVWRLGMDQATEITSTGNLVVGGQQLKAGKYSLWVKKTGDDSWELDFHPKTGIWGNPPLTEGFVASTPLKLEKAPDSVEQLTINLSSQNNEAVIAIHWGTLVLTGSFQVS